MVKTGQSLTFQFPSVGSTGALTNADSTPTCTMYVDGVADGGSVTVTNSATGRYKAVCTVPTLTAGQCFEVWAAFAVATVNGGGLVFRDMADTTYQSETYARIGAAGAGLTAVAIGAGGVTAASIATDAAQEIADTVLRRTAANIEASANGDTLSVESLYGVIMASFEAALSGTTLTVRKSDGTTLGTKTVTVDSAADPITGIT